MVTTGNRGEIESQVAEMTPAFDVDLDHEHDLEEGLLFNGEEWAQIERDLGPNPSRGAIWKWKEDREASGNLTAWSRHVALRSAREKAAQS